MRHQPHQPQDMILQPLLLLLTSPLHVLSSSDSFCDFHQPGKCFVYDESRYLSLREASLFCSSLNLTLASISTRAENAVLRSMIGVSDTWINSLATDFSEPSIIQWTKFHSKCNTFCCGVYVSGDGIWRDDDCKQLHGVVCQRYILSSGKRDATQRMGKSVRDRQEEEQNVSHQEKEPTISAVTPFLLLFAVLFITCCIIFTYLTKSKSSYSTNRRSSRVS